jgi:para-nitrobenzyl esterase
MQIALKAVCALVVAGLALGVSKPMFADPLTVKTEQGKVHGKNINDGKVKAFLGLPYAAPPVGEMRWKAPAAAAKWKGDEVRGALRAGPGL